MALNGLQQQFVLAIPLMAAVRKVSRVWRLLGTWALLSYLITATGRASGILRILSNRFAEGSFATRLWSYILGWLGLKGHPFARLADFVDLVSTLFRHAGSTLKTATDILNKINDFRSFSGPQHRIPQARVPSTNESDAATSQESTGTVRDNIGRHDGQLGLQQIIVSSISEGDEAVLQWKKGNSQFYVDVPSNMPTCTDVALKRNFKKMGADHLLQGATINSILEKALVAAKSVSDIAAKEFEDLQQLLQLSSPPEMLKTNGETLGRGRLLQKWNLNCDLSAADNISSSKQTVCLLENELCT